MTMAAAQQDAIVLQLSGLYRYRRGREPHCKVSIQTIVDSIDDDAVQRNHCVLELTAEHMILRLNSIALASYAWENTRKVGLRAGRGHGSLDADNVCAIQVTHRSRRQRSLARTQQLPPSGLTPTPPLPMPFHRPSTCAPSLACTGSRGSFSSTGRRPTHPSSLRRTSNPSTTPW